MPHCDTLIEQLRQRGYRITPQRELIIETIAHSGHHLTAEEVAEAVQPRMRALNITTIYRTLDFLAREGIVSRLDMGGGKTVFATTAHGPHIHIYCRQCGVVIEVEHDAFAATYAQFRQYMQETHGFLLELKHFSLPGVCPRCQSHEAHSPKQEGYTTRYELE